MKSAKLMLVGGGWWFVVEATNYQPPTTNLFRSHQRKQNDIANRMAVGQQHDQPIDADAFAGRRWHAELERPHVVLVHRVGFFVAARALSTLFLEPPLLLRRIVQLAEGVGHLEARNVELEAL